MFWKLCEQIFKIIIRFQIIRFRRLCYAVNNCKTICTIDGVNHFPMQNPRIARSLALLSSGTSPSFRNTRRYHSWFKAYVNASCILLLFDILFCFRYTNKASTSGLPLADTEQGVLLMIVLIVSSLHARLPVSVS